MVKYIIDVIKHARRFPYRKGDNFKIWLRNTLYLNWQQPWKWNIDVYWLYKTIRRASNDDKRNDGNVPLVEIR